MAEGSAKDSGNGAESYTHEELLDEPRALAGCSRHVLAGALAVEKRQKLTSDQAKDAVTKALKRSAAAERRAA